MGFIPLNNRWAKIAVALSVLWSLLYLNSGDQQNSSPLESGQWVRVSHVTDGDTIGFGTGKRYQSVRLIGIDTPETVHPRKPVEFYGPEASAFTKHQLDGARVRLEFEPTQQFDRYDRLLAYVYMEDGTLFNALLLQQGYARVIAPQPFSYYRKFKMYEKKAKQEKLGLWNKSNYE